VKDLAIVNFQAHTCFASFLGVFTFHFQDGTDMLEAKRLSKQRAMSHLLIGYSFKYDMKFSRFGCSNS
jgi:hypothetical protein